jgi:exoribonuclease-2
MHVIFEDDGQLKGGTVLADQETSLQVEAASGRRAKVKAANVLLRFTDPSPAEALATGHKLAADLDPAFLWEASGDDEFGFDDLAREYYGASARPVEQIAVAMLLHASPMYFYKRGKGRYRKAPEDALRAALASVARKQREQAQIAEWVAMLARHELPDAFRPKLAMLLYKPDRNATEWKALAAACETQRTNPVALLAACGAIPSTHDYHYNRFLVEAFPNGVAFPAHVDVPPIPELPHADVRAFSIDDPTTTEIDDAFSVRWLHDGHVEIGIHIAAPALSVTRGTPLDAIARQRLSTVYMPGRKLTMLPERVVDAFSLDAGDDRPALSLYVVTTAEGVPVRHETRVERITVAHNLRLPDIDGAFAGEPAESEGLHTRELRGLWRLAQHLFAARGKSDVNRIDYSFDVDWDAASPLGEAGRVSIVQRPRGSPLDKLVSELMIHVNNTWGRLLAERGAVGLYRTQSMGKVKMSTRPAEHQGLGLTHYLWSSSPLRRYSDLVNQRQLLAVVAGERPPYADNDAELFAALADFEATYGQYAEFQDRMEHYWCLRWLLQEGVRETTATVIRENLVRFDRLPLVMRLGDLPALPAETRVAVAIGAIDLLNATLECRYAGRLAATL